MEKEGGERTRLVLIFFLGFLNSCFFFLPPPPVDIIFFYSLFFISYS